MDKLKKNRPLPAAVANMEAQSITMKTKGFPVRDMATLESVGRAGV